jgi:tRNA A-37 threonylcarbamoyl transferase component Bud32
MSAIGLGTQQRAFRQLFELGRGGMARIYLAESLASGIRKLVVLKVLNSELSIDPEMRAAFRREAELSAQMNHPNVVQVLEVFESASTPVIVMEYLEGISLASLLKTARAALPLALHVSILAQVLAGLHHFHELRDLDGSLLNAVHRDVSPQNVMILHDGPVKVLDFGIAKVSAPQEQATSTGIVKGKLHYMPPEQLIGDHKIDRRADLFAVGVLLWEAVAGKRMWEGKSDAETMRALAMGELPRLRDVASDAPESLLSIVERATSINVERRFATARDMQLAIESAMSERGWLVQPRAVAEFMRVNFGAGREQVAQMVKQALRTPAEGKVVEVLRTPLPAQATEQHSDAPPLGVTRHSRIPERGRHLGLVALVCVALGGAWLLSRGRPSEPAAAMLQTPARLVSLEIDAAPAGAEILLDGRRLGQDHVVVSEPASSHVAVLEIRAAGHVTARREVSLDQNSSVDIALKPEVTAPPATATTTSTTTSATATATTTATRSLASKPHSSLPATKPAHKPKTRAGNCNPPFTVGADGVKTYKTECF